MGECRRADCCIAYTHGAQPATPPQPVVVAACRFRVLSSEPAGTREKAQHQTLKPGVYVKTLQPGQWQSRCFANKIQSRHHAAISDSGASRVTRPRFLESIPSCSHFERIRLVVK